jgi:predicted nucleic acid-binding protein
LAAFLVDTNVLAYAYDPRDPDRQARATACLRRLAASRQGALSAQVLGEFFWVATRRLDPPLTAEQAERSITNYARSWPVYPLTSQAVLEAVRAVRQHQFSYWDALIWATAKLNGVLSILTEDQPSSSLIEGVRFINPLDQGFDLARLG